MWATGNGGVHDDDCGCDGYVSSPYSLSVGSITDRGQAPYFDEKCASTLTVVPSGGEIRAGEFEGQPKIKVVSDRRRGLKKSCQPLVVLQSVWKSFKSVLNFAILYNYLVPGNFRKYLIFTFFHCEIFNAQELYLVFFAIRNF